MQENKKVWFVTGASKGLGLALVKKLLEKNFRVTATSRNAGSLIEAVGAQSNNFLPLEMNLSDEESVGAAIRKTNDRFGALDSVVNNAGYGLLGTLEELSDAEARENFEVNVFGALNVIRAAMPVLREQRAGHVFNISSIGGFTANFPGGGIYCATKFALAALTEALAAEASSFGVRATVVYPGYFRTNFLAKDSIAYAKNPIAEYAAARRSDEFHQNEMNGNQAGDPEKLAEVLIRVAANDDPPLHLFLGNDAYGLAEAKIAAVQKDLRQWRDLATATDFAAQAAG